MSRNENHRAVPLMRGRWQQLATSLAIGAILTIPDIASAQLMGRIRRAVQERVPNKTEPSEAAALSVVPPLEITIDRLDVFLVAMQPVVQHATRVARARDAQDRYDAGRRALDVCREQQLRAHGATPATLSMNDQLALGNTAVAVVEVMAVANAANARGDVAVANAALDSADVLDARARMLQYPALAACGLPTTRPSEPPQPAVSQDDLLRPLPGGMSGAQFGRLRERIALHLLTKGDQAQLSASEQQVVSLRANELAPFAALFRSGALEYARWNGLGSAWKSK
jgi:hypothetical protein